MKNIRFILYFVIFLLAQVMIFNQFLFQSYLNPYLYILFILYLPARSNFSLVLLVAFIMGMTIDFFENSAGVHAAASTLTAFLRPWFLRILQRKLDGNEKLELKTLGIAPAFAYFLSLLFIHHFALFLIEAFSLSEIATVLLRSLYSTLFSFTFVVLYQLWNYRR